MLKHLKTTMKNQGSFIKCLFDKEISISLSHCNFLIAFYELAEKYPKFVSVLYNCVFSQSTLKL